MKMQKTAISILLFAAILIMISCSNATKEIASIKIGTQTWAVKNLDVTTFRNGDIIPEAKTNEEWKKSGDEQKPAWCYYNNDPANGEKYGKLYNWYAVNDPRGLAPEGWHIPTDAEWTTLTAYLEEAGGNVKKPVQHIGQAQTTEQPTKQALQPFRVASGRTMVRTPGLVTAVTGGLLLSSLQVLTTSGT